MRGGGGQKMSVFVHAQGIKTVYAGGGVKKWQNSVHLVVECPLVLIFESSYENFFKLLLNGFLHFFFHEMFINYMNYLIEYLFIFMPKQLV